MPPPTKAPITLSKKALIRFRFISMVHAFIQAEYGVEQAVRLVAKVDLDGKRVSTRTLYRWLKAEEAGPQGLEPKARAPLEGSRVIDDELVTWMVAQKDLDPKASIPELIDRARQAGLLHPTAQLHRSTVWRVLKRRGVDTRRVASVGKDARRFAYTERMQLVMADFKHFRAGPTRRKRLALYLLDDATRFGLHVSVHTGGESAAYVLAGVYAVLRRYGRFAIFYVDQGSGFIADALAQVLAQIDPPIALVLGTAGYPEGRGKIERFNRSVKARLLRHLAKEGVDPDLGALTLRLNHDLNAYNQRPHRGLDGDTPKARWERSERPLRSAGDDLALRNAFTLALERKVSKDHIVSVDKVKYEVPRGHARTKVTLHRRLLEVTDERDALYIEHRGEMVRLFEVDLEANAKSGRAQRPRPTPNTNNSPAVQSAAERAFSASLRPMTTSDGGYADKEEK